MSESDQRPLSAQSSRLAFSALTDDFVILGEVEEIGPPAQQAVVRRHRAQGQLQSIMSGCSIPLPKEIQDDWRHEQESGQTVQTKRCIV